MNMAHPSSRASGSIVYLLLILNMLAIVGFVSIYFRLDEQSLALQILTTAVTSQNRLTLVVPVVPRNPVATTSVAVVGAPESAVVPVINVTSTIPVIVTPTSTPELLTTTYTTRSWSDLTFLFPANATITTSSTAFFQAGPGPGWGERCLPTQKDCVSGFSFTIQPTTFDASNASSTPLDPVFTIRHPVKGVDSFIVKSASGTMYLVQEKGSYDDRANSPMFNSDDRVTYDGAMINFLTSVR